MLKGILFDLGSTLIEFDNTDWVQLERECLRQAYDFVARSNRMPEWIEFADSFLNTFHQAWIEADQTLKEIKLAEWVSQYLEKNHVISQDGMGSAFIDQYYQPIRKQISLIDGAVEVLQEFKTKGYKIGLISNSSFPSEYHLAELQQYGLKEYFDFLIFSHDYGFRKPHSGLFKTALQALKLKPEESVFIGDRLREDVAGAKSVGMKGILKFKDGRDYSLPVVPDAVIHHLDELPKVVEKL